MSYPRRVGRYRPASRLLTILHGRRPYRASAVTFDGTNDSLARGATPTGLVDHHEGTFSVWAKMAAAGDGLSQRFLQNTLSRIQIFRGSSNTFGVLGDSTGGRILDINSVVTVTGASGWMHLMASWHLGGTPVSDIYVNDVLSEVVTTRITGNIDYATGNMWIGQTGSGTLHLNADVADLWFSPVYIDLSVEANRRKFISAAGKPVDLGANGDRPTGTAPLIFYSGNAAVWNAGTNKGTGGNFPMSGAVADAATSPSD